jgi:hypothetical protein
VEARPREDEDEALEERVGRQRRCDGRHDAPSGQALSAAYREQEEGDEAGKGDEGEYRQSHSLPTFAARIVTSSFRGLSPTYE